MEEERLEWQRKFDPRNIQLGMVPRDIFIDFNNKEYFDEIKTLVEHVEEHMGERFPEDFRKYLLYCGHLFYNWSCIGIEFIGEDFTCVCCERPLNGSKCLAPAPIRFSHEGCGIYKYIVIKGSQKGLILNNDFEPVGETFMELLERIYRP